eukprot:3306272-Pyramimonas_sp.AAC.1
MQCLRDQEWDAVEDLYIKAIEDEEGWMTILETLDSVRMYDQMTELPTDFNSFFSVWLAIRENP